MINRKNELLLRVYLVLLVFVAVAGIIGWKIIDISLLEGAKWKKQEENRYLKWRPVKAQRGDIYSDDGERLLASSIEFFEIRMDPVAPNDKDFNEGIYGLCIGLERLLGTASAQLWRDRLEGARNAYGKSKRSGSRNILISRKADDELLLRLKTLPLFKLGKNKGGLKVTRFYSRKKTFQELASRTLGEYREKDLVGIEKMYDKELRGEERKELMRFIPPDLWIPLYDPTDFEVMRGKDVVTTLNVDVQDVVHHELEKGIISNNAEAGVVVVMDVKTGFIKAMSNLHFKNGGVAEVDNWAVTQRSEPGSTFKAMSTLAMLEGGVAVNKKVRIDNGTKKFYDLRMYDSNYPHDDIMSDLKESFIKSSNVGIASLAQDRFGSKEARKEFYNFLGQFGLLEKSGIDLVGEPDPFIKNPSKDRSWSGVTIPWMAHGYELQITPLQTLAFYNAIANGGVYMKPRLVKSINHGEKAIKRFSPQAKNQRIASEENINIIQELMKETVLRGTGKNIYSEQYLIAGKTGTASFDYTGDKEKGYNASFAGFFPADSPKYSMIVVVYGLRGKKYYGSQVAGPVFKEVADRLMSLGGGLEVKFAERQKLSLPNSAKGFGGDFENLYSDLGLKQKNRFPRWTRNESDGKRTLAQKSLIRKSEVPDVKGMGLRDAMYVLENIGVKVEINGSGKVYKQSLRPGTKLSGKAIEIYLN